MLEIAAFGKISVGKSALLNALFSTDVFTVDPRGGSTAIPQCHIVRFGEYEINIIDTPGIGEVDGASRSQIARDVAKEVDLVLVLFDHDPTQVEYTEVEKLADASKPMLILLNKADALSKDQRDQLFLQIIQRLTNQVDPANVLICSADPLRHLAEEMDDGSVREWSERAAPDIAQVRERLLNVIQTESQILQDIDQAARDAQSEEARISIAKDRASDLIDDFALGGAVVVAANPLPLLDVLGGGAGFAVLVRQLARCYNVDITQSEIKELASHLVQEGRSVLWTSIVPMIGGSLLKFIPVVGWAISALPQATASYYFTWVLGHACSEYFAADKTWAGSLRETIQQVIDRTDRKSVSRRAAEKIKDRIGG